MFTLVEGDLQRPAATKVGIYSCYALKLDCNKSLEKHDALQKYIDEQGRQVQQYEYFIALGVTNNGKEVLLFTSSEVRFRLRNR